MYRHPYPPSEDDANAPRLVSKWLVGFLLALAFLALLVALQAMQVTSEEAAKRTLRRTVAAATEIDVLIERHHDELVARAQATGPNESIELEAFPIGVSLTRDEVLNSTPEELAGLLLDRSANVLYEDGADAWLSERGTDGDAGTFSASGLVERSMGFLRERVHLASGVVVIALSIVSIVLAAALAASSRGFGRLTSLAVALLAGTAVFLAVTGAARLILELASPSEYIESEFIAIGEELLQAPLRNGLAFAAFGAVLLALGVAGSRWSDGRASREAA